jgi:hypothetical protein
VTQPLPKARKIIPGRMYAVYVSDSLTRAPTCIAVRVIHSIKHQLKPCFLVRDVCPVQTGDASSSGVFQQWIAEPEQLIDFVSAPALGDLSAGTRIYALAPMSTDAIPSKAGKQSEDPLEGWTTTFFAAHVVSVNRPRSAKSLHIMGIQGALDNEPHLRIAFPVGTFFKVSPHTFSFFFLFFLCFLLKATCFACLM